MSDEIPSMYTGLGDSEATRATEHSQVSDTGKQILESTQTSGDGPMTLEAMRQQRDKLAASRRGEGDPNTRIVVSRVSEQEHQEASAALGIEDYEKGLITFTKDETNRDVILLPDNK
jgi:hypothetical protein